MSGGSEPVEAAAGGSAGCRQVRPREMRREVAARWRAYYIREDQPGASRARNRGAEEARGDIVAFTDDDAAPDSDWLGSILPQFSDAGVALVAGKVFAPVSGTRTQPFV